MGRKAYTKDLMEREKGEMKESLRNWGKAMDRFNWKEEELKKANGIYEVQKNFWRGQHTKRGERELERIEREYRERAGKLRIEMVEILREKRWMDEMIRGLTQDEQMFVEFRFEKGYGMEYIGTKMHMSHASVYRLQARILAKLIAKKKEECD